MGTPSQRGLMCSPVSLYCNPTFLFLNKSGVRHRVVLRYTVVLWMHLCLVMRWSMWRYSSRYIIAVQYCSPDAWGAPQWMGKRHGEHRPQQSRPYRAQNRCHTRGQCCLLLRTSRLELLHRVLGEQEGSRPPCHPAAMSFHWPLPPSRRDVGSFSALPERTPLTLIRHSIYLNVP